MNRYHMTALLMQTAGDFFEYTIIKKGYRWFSVGDHVDRWRIARGEPDSILWLAATGTMQIPREPFALIESRGHPVDALMTDAVRCQKGFADLSFIYWAIGTFLSRKLSILYLRSG